MLMSVNDQASAAQACATTPSGTTPVSALWTTCRSMEGTTAWVGLHMHYHDVINQLNGGDMQSCSDFFFLIDTQTWGRATATGTFTLTTKLVMESWPITWLKRCAAAPTTLAAHGINPVNSVPCPVPVRSQTRMCRKFKQGSRVKT